MPRATKATDAAKPPGAKASAGARRATGDAKAKASAGARHATAKAAKAKAAEQPAATKRAARPPADKFLAEQRALLEGERATYEEQAAALKAEADQLAQEMEPGDVQFDDESGEGGTVNVDRERDLALSAQARVEVEEIDHALAKIAAGTYGTCERCGQPIPKPRLKALPQARLCVSCKSGGLSRR